MADGASTSDARRTWDMAAPGWAKWEQAFCAGLRDPTETLLDMAGIGPGMRILDLASGPEARTIQVARRVGPEGASALSAAGLSARHRPSTFSASQVLMSDW
jgi:hypothetical protein